MTAGMRTMKHRENRTGEDKPVRAKISGNKIVMSLAAFKET